MVVWRFWQQSYCHSIPSAAMGRNSCCVMWPSLLSMLPFSSFGQGTSTLGPQAMTCGRCALSAGFYITCWTKHQLYVWPGTVYFDSALLPTFLTVDCIIWAVLVLPTYFSQSYGWCLGILRWIRSCAVLRSYSILPTLTEGFIPWNTQCLPYFIFWKSVVFLNLPESYNPNIWVESNKRACSRKGKHGESSVQEVLLLTWKLQDLPLCSD